MIVVVAGELFLRRCGGRCFFSGRLSEFHGRFDRGRLRSGRFCRRFLGVLLLFLFALRLLLFLRPLCVIGLALFARRKRLR